ncbi:hypothetical protein GCM10020358_67030 [Amorphoplanes nipponensis]
MTVRRGSAIGVAPIATRAAPGGGGRLGGGPAQPAELLADLGQPGADAGVTISTMLWPDLQPALRPGRAGEAGQHLLHHRGVLPGDRVEQQELLLHAHRQDHRLHRSRRAAPGRGAARRGIGAGRLSPGGRR